MGLAANVAYTVLFTVPGWDQLVGAHVWSPQRSAWGVALALGSLLAFACLYNVHGVCQVGPAGLLRGRERRARQRAMCRCCSPCCTACNGNA